MKNLKRALYMMLLGLLIGCSGVEIKTLSHTEMQRAFGLSGNCTNDCELPGDDRLKGLILYEPMIVVSVSVKEVCVKGDKEEDCVTTAACHIGDPFTLPDYSKPYLVKVKSGFGKAGTELTIHEGWRLDGLKDESDNSTVLESLLAIGGVSTAGITESKLDCKPGLYRLTFDSGYSLEQIGPSKLPD